MKDEKVAITTQVKKWLEEDIDVIITTGGTGIAQRDVTIEAVKPLLTKEIEGFGGIVLEIFGYVEDVGTRALLSRAVSLVQLIIKIFLDSRINRHQFN